MGRVGYLGKLTTQPGQRNALVDVLLQAADLLKDAAGCELYVINTSQTEDDAVWVMELWSDADAHAASLTCDDVRRLIGKAMPLLAGRPERIDLTPVGGVGLRS